MEEIGRNKLWELTCLDVSMYIRVSEKVTEVNVVI